MGGLGAHVLTLASDCGLIDAGLKLRPLRLPDIFQDQDKPEKQYADAGLDADGIVETLLKALRYNDRGVFLLVERRVGKGGVSTFRSWGFPHCYKKLIL